MGIVNIMEKGGKSEHNAVEGVALMVKGISIKVDAATKVWLCIVAGIADDLKKIIRDRLSSVCHGPSRAGSGRMAYSYKETLKEFLKRYNPKPPETKKGMIGELLAHILINECISDMQTVSPYLNLEEKSIKKGFDIVMRDSARKGLWFTEVKAGEVNDKPSDDVNAQLLNNAKNDLKKKLNTPRTTCWLNAINGAAVVYEDSNKRLRKAVQSILETHLEEAQKGKSTSLSKNAILVSVLYGTLGDNPKHKTIRGFHDSVVAENIFSGLMIFSIQKGTYKKIHEFLEEEAR